MQQGDRGLDSRKPFAVVLDNGPMGIYVREIGFVFVDAEGLSGIFPAIKFGAFFSALVSTFTHSLRRCT